MNALVERLDVIRSVVADPPIVHSNGVWRTDLDCYQFLAHQSGPMVRTLETGLGVSTVLLTIWGCEHTCVVPSRDEVETCTAYLEARGIATNHLTFVLGQSDKVLPSLEGEVDLVFIDGGHGFPTPLLDWYYAGSLLRKGGVLVLDDLNLESVRLGLLEFIDRDRRWIKLKRTAKWGAWQRLTSGSLGEEWNKQQFLSVASPGLVRRARNKVGRRLRLIGVTENPLLIT